MNGLAYTAQSGMPTRRRKQRRSAIVLGVIFGFLLLALVLAYALNKGWLGASAAPKSATATATKAACVTAKAPNKVTVNVYNATTKDGLARSAAAALQLQGFLVATVGNDPLSKQLPGVGEIRYGPNGRAQGRALYIRVPGVRAVQDTRADTSVDLVLGEKYTKISTPRKGAGGC